MFRHVDAAFAADVAAGLGIELTGEAPPPPRTFRGEPAHAASPALSLANQPRTSIKSRRVAILAADGVSAAEIKALKDALGKEGAVGEVIGIRGGTLKVDQGEPVAVDKSLATVSSVMYDGVYVPGGAASAAALSARVEAVELVQDAFRHAKTIGATAEGIELVAACKLPGVITDVKEADPAEQPGVVLGRPGKAGGFAASFVAALKQHRHFDRETKVPPG
jgi:catalase